MERFKLSYTRSRRQKIISVLAAIIVFVTTYALILPAITIDTDTAEKEPGIDVGAANTAETAALPAASLEESVEGITVSVEADAGVFPENTSLSLKVEDSGDSAMQTLLEAAVQGKINNYEAVEIAFEDENGETVDPQDVFTVKVISDSMEEQADRALVQVTGEVATIVESPEFTYKQVEFSADANATYAIVEKSELTTEYLSADGNLYEVNVTYDYTAQIPDNASLVITEFPEGSAEYEANRQAFLDAMPADESGTQAAPAGTDGESTLTEDGVAVPDGQAENAEAAFMDIFDLSIYAEDGSKVEPATPVQVSIMRKNLPENFDSKDGGLVVQHLNESTSTPFVENIDSAVAVTAGSITANFETGSFSYYAFTWQPNNGQYRTVRIHYGYKDASNQFYEFDSSLLKQTPTINQSTEFAYLIYDVEGYQYSQTYYNNSNSTNSPTNNNNHPTISGNEYIETIPMIRYTSSRWRYWDGDSFEAMSYGSGTNRYSDIYVCYEPLDAVTHGGTAKAYETAENPDKPEMDKESTNNNDGTRTITLSVDGHQTPVLHEKLADVIVVFDRSGSMQYNMDGSQTSGVAAADQRITTALNAVGQLADELLSDAYKNKDGRPQIRMSLVTFSTNAQAETLSTDQAIMVDGQYWQNYPDYNFTTSATKFKNLLSGVTADGGTNWEQALQIANRLPVDPERETFVIFVTDGDPTFRVSRSPTTNNSDATIKSDTFNSPQRNNEDATYYQYYRENDVFGQGNNDSSGYNYAAALAEAQSIVGQDKKLYCIAIGAQGSVTKMQRLSDEAGASGCFEADDEESLNAAFRDIKESIVGHYGWNNVDLVDGITTLTNLTAKANLVGVDFTEMTYTKIEHKPEGDVVTENWDPTSERCQLAWYNEELGAVEWDMGPNFQLKDNCTYQVHFKVWPSEEAIDLVTQLNNHMITLDDLTPEQASQFEVVSDGGYTIYTLKTNTEAGMTYTLSRDMNGVVTPYGDPIYEACEFEQKPLVMLTMPMRIQKQFDDSLAETEGDGVGEDRPTSVVLELWRRALDDPNAVMEAVSIFPDGNGGYTNRITLSEANGWQTEVFYVSPGLVDKFKTTREAGYEYIVKEPDVDYHYELNAEELNPLMEGYGNTDAGLDYDEALKKQREVYIVKNYNGDMDENTDLTAINVVKGGMDIKKIVRDASGSIMDSDREFTIKGWILDPEGNPYTFDPALDDRTDQSQKIKENNQSEAPLFFAHQDDPLPYHFYDKNGNRTIYKGHFTDTSNIEFTIKGGEELRFPLIPDGCTYSFWEETEDMNGFVLTSVEGIAEEKRPVPGGDGYDYYPAEDQEKYPVVDENNHVSGIIYGNTLDDLTFTNTKVNPGSIIIKKTVTKSDGQTELFPEEDFTVTGYIRYRSGGYWTPRYSGRELDYIKRDKDGNVISTGTITDTYNSGSGFAMLLKAGDTFEILNVPDGDQYWFQENALGADSGYSFYSVTGTATNVEGGTVQNPPTPGNDRDVSGTMHSDEEHDILYKNMIDRDPTELRLVKVDSQDETKRLNDAAFALYTDADHTTPAVDYQGYEIGAIVTGGFSDAEQTVPLGQAEIGWLWPGTYYLVETGPPNGYRPLSDHVVITINDDGTVSMTHPDNASANGNEFVSENNGLITIRIPDTKINDKPLPSTGGIGTHLFYISGGLLLMAAAGIYIFSFRRRKGGRRRPDFL